MVVKPLYNMFLKALSTPTFVEISRPRGLAERRRAASERRNRNPPPHTTHNPSTLDHFFQCARVLSNKALDQVPCSTRTVAIAPEENMASGVEEKPWRKLTVLPTFLLMVYSIRCFSTRSSSASS